MRLQSLDVLRAAAVLLVIGTHLEGNPLRPWYVFGWTGVDLFFILSGFLVSGLLFREFQEHGTIRPGHFLLRRALKIYPAFYVFIAGSLVAQYVHGGHLRPMDLIGESLFIQNYGWHMWPHTWSLAVEEHFYLLLALGLLLLVRLDRSRAPFRRLIPVYLVIVVLTWFLRAAWAAGVPGLGDPLRATHFRMEALAMGVAISYYFHFHHGSLSAFVKKNRLALAIAPAMLFAPFFVFQWEYDTAVVAALLSLVNLGYTCILLLVLMGELQTSGRMAALARPLGRGMAWIGRRSYSIYLWHLAVIYLVMQVTRSSGRVGWPVVALAVAACVMVGWATAAMVENPVLRLRNSLIPSRAKSISTMLGSGEEKSQAA